MPAPEKGPLRLTLRTLLAYLDDTLDPTQVGVIGQKVAESDTAQELITRIKQVTRRRRLTTPPAGSRLDPNVIAEYLDNCLSEDQVAQLEQTCLSSDINLAEVSACHQILTLVLGEPMLIPPPSRQRMYGLVKGKESIPFRRPPYVEASEEDVQEDLVPDDDVVRPLGLPIVRPGGNWLTLSTIVGSALAAGILLVVSIALALRPPSADPLDDPGKQVAQVPGNGKQPPDPKPSPAKPEPKQTEPTVPPPDPKKTDREPPPDPIPPDPMPMPPNPLPAEVVPIAAPSTARRDVGAYDPGKAGPSVLLQFDPEKRQWRRLDMRAPVVQTGSPLVSLPGFRSVLRLKKGLRLDLWGNLREVGYFPPVQESLVELHDHELLDLDLTLRRGRITLANLRPLSSRVRVRFDNPTNPSLRNVWDLTLEKDTEVLLDHWSAFTAGEPFYKKADDPNRVGPQANLHLLVLKGRVSLRRDNQTLDLQDPPGTALQVWSSFTATRGGELPAVPDWATNNPKGPANLAAEFQKRLDDNREKMLAARDKLGTALTGKSEIDVMLPQVLKSDNPYERTLALRCFGAVNDLGSLIDALADPQRRDVRQAALDTLQRWIACERDNDHVLYAELQKIGYQRIEAENIMTLLHKFSAKQSGDRETYEALVEYLDNPKLAIRELAAWHLYILAPIGQGIRYEPAADANSRRLAIREWEKLIESGKVPQPRQ